MIEINLLGKKKKMKAPTIAGINLLRLPWIPILVCHFIANYQPIGFYKGINKEAQAKLQGEIGVKKKEVKKLKKEVKKNDVIKGQLKAFTDQIEKLEKRSKQVEEIIKLRTNPRHILEKFYRSIPEDMWFEEIKISKDLVVTINGAAETYGSIGDFIVDINESPYFGKTFQLKDAKTQEVDEGGVKRRQETFEISGKIKLFDPFLTGK